MPQPSYALCACSGRPAIALLAAATRNPAESTDRLAMPWPPTMPLRRSAQEKMCIRNSGSHTLHQRVKQVQAHGACQASLVPARRASYFIQPRQNHASAKLELRISARSIKPGAPSRRHDHAATGVVTGATRPSRTVGRGASRTLGPRRAAKGRSNRRMAGSSFRCDRSDSRRRRAR